jgi:hypothetical protein
MSENTPNKNVREDEIDLLDLFRRMGNTISKWAKALGRGFLIASIFLLRRWLPLGISVILGLAMSSILKVTSDSFYTSDIVFRNNLVSNSDMIAYLNRLHTYSREKNLIALSEALSVSSENVDNILDISAFWIIDQGSDGIPDFVDYKNKQDVYDTVNVKMKDRLDVRVVIKSPQELSILRDGIISFIDKDSLFQQRNRIRLRQNLEFLARLDYDILQLDSLQKIKYFEETKSRQPQGGGQMIFIQEQKTQLIYSEIQELFSEKQRREADRDLYQGIVTVLSDFSIPAVRDNGGLYYAKKTVPIFIILTLILLIVIANWKKIKDVYDKY